MIIWKSAITQNSSVLTSLTFKDNSKLNKDRIEVFQISLELIFHIFCKL